MTCYRRIILLGCALSAWGQTRYFINTIAGSNPIGDNGPATRALLWNPTDVAVDGEGNFYIADASNHRIRKVTSAGMITTIACTGIAGYTGEGGTATQAECNNPTAITVDAAGNVYFSDTGNQRVRKIGLDGKISLVAGTGSGSFSGDGSAANAAALNGPAGLATDAAGNLYIADMNNNRIRRITSEGNINTIAGTGSAGLTGDNGLATLAKLSGPHALTIDSAGLVLVADTNNSRIRRFVLGGNITTIAGNKAGFSGDNGEAISASLLKPDGIAIDSKGVIYISDSGNQRIRMVATNGIISTLAGSSVGFHGDGTSEANGLFNNPQGIAVDNKGNLYIADSGNARIRVIYPSHILNTIAGSGRYQGDNGPALSAVLTNPSFVTLDNMGDILVSDQDNHVVRRVNPAGTITTIAGSGVPGSLGDGGPATSAQLNSPQGLAVDSLGNVYVADAVNATVRKITPDGTIFPFAGGGTVLNDGGSALKAKLNLAGVCVLFGTERAPILLVTPGQLNVQVPVAATSGTVTVQVISNCDSANQAVSGTSNVAVQAATPEFFYAAGNSVAAVDGVSGAAIGPGFATAYPGETVTIYATGLGLTTPAFATGQLPPSGAPVGNAIVSIDGVALDPSAVQYAGVTPLNAGLYQLNIVLPASLPSGDHTIAMSVSGWSSPAGHISVGIP